MVNILLLHCYKYTHQYKYHKKMVKYYIIYNTELDKINNWMIVNKIQNYMLNIDHQEYIKDNLKNS